MAKDALLMLLGRKPKDKADGGGDDDDRQELKIAAQDFLDAVKSDDADGVASAFKSMHSICNSYDEG